MAQNLQSQQDQRALAHIQTAFGQPGSGRLRYAAAMHFNRNGLISDAVLEVYRICAANDAEDPTVLLRQRGLNVPFSDLDEVSHNVKLRMLVEEIDRYLGEHRGPGIGEVRQGISRSVFATEYPTPVPENLLVATYLDTALRLLSQSHPALAASISGTDSLLNWVAFDGYPAEEIGTDFQTNHAFASIIGKGACATAGDFDLGLFLIAPNILYRDHKHAAPELYAPLTGPHGWRFGTDQPLIIKPAHEPVWNEPNRPHLTKVGSQPFLCIYGWTKDVDQTAQVLPADDWPELEAMRVGG